MLLDGHWACQAGYSHQDLHGSVKVAYDAIEHGSLIVCRR